MSGLGIGNQNTLQFMADSSPPDGNPGVIASFITAGRAVEFQQLTDNQQKSSVLSDLAAYFGPDAAQPKELILQNWNQEDWSSAYCNVEKELNHNSIQPQLQISSPVNQSNSSAKSFLEMNIPHQNIIKLKNNPSKSVNVQMEDEIKKARIYPQKPSIIFQLPH